MTEGVKLEIKNKGKKKVPHKPSEMLNKHNQTPVDIAYIENA